MTTALLIGRFAPAHVGHIKAIEKLLNDYDKVVIGLGSCYDLGTKRAPLLAVYREKILLGSLYMDGIDCSRIEIVHIPDYDTFDEWLNDILIVCDKYKVTHFVTGNNEDILNVLKERKIKLPYEFVNPENDTFVKCHASELREAIVKGDVESFEKYASSGAKMLLGTFDGFNKIKTSFLDEGRSFNKGKQSCDLVFTIQERVKTQNGKPYLRTYILAGNRPLENPDFPGYLGIVGTTINRFESPINAVVRALKEKTGITCDIKRNYCEPAIVVLKSDNGDCLANLGFLQFYNDKLLAGMGGGSSQCFYININGNPKMFDEVLKNSNFRFIPVNDCLDQPMAYQHKDMVRDALGRLSHYAE